MLSVSSKTHDLPAGITAKSLQTDQSLPLCLEPVDSIDLIAWADSNQAWIRQALDHHGGLLFRGFSLPDLSAFSDFVAACGGKQLLEYTYRSTPRTQVQGRIYTSTEFPPKQHIPLHNENAYSRSWPELIGFYSAIAAETGGETPIADSREIYRQIDPRVRARFEELGVMYVRNYGALDLPWQTVFQTESRDEVERFCRESEIEFTWKDGDELQTRQVCQASLAHPRTGEKVWFNQAHLFHVSSLDTDVRESLVEVLGEENLPRNAYYGDGSPIDSHLMDDIRGLYDRSAIAFPWQQGDILLLDNLLAAHGRRPFTGERKVLVGMA